MTSSISSAFERIMRRQQYRTRPRLSRTFAESSPFRVRSRYTGHALATTLPHVKQRIGMIIGSPVRLLPLLPRPAAEGVLRELPPGVRDDQRAVVVPEQGLELLVVQVLHEAARDCGAGSVRLSHDPAAVHVHVDVDAFRLLAGELERFEDLHPRELHGVDLHGHAVHPNGPAALPDRRPRDRRLPLPARDDDLHRDTSNFEPRPFEISPSASTGP